MCTEETASTKRQVPRFPLIADAEFTAVNDGTHMNCRISDLSARGCYVDILNPLPVDTEIRLRIRHGGRGCEIPCKVIYMHAGFGMGVLFGDIAPDQRAVLDGWLSQLGAEAGS